MISSKGQGFEFKPDVKSNTSILTTWKLSGNKTISDGKANKCALINILGEYLELWFTDDCKGVSY